MSTKKYFANDDDEIAISTFLDVDQIVITIHDPFLTDIDICLDEQTAKEFITDLQNQLYGRPEQNNGFDIPFDIDDPITVEPWAWKHWLILTGVVWVLFGLAFLIIYLTGGL